MELPAQRRVDAVAADRDGASTSAGGAPAGSWKRRRTRVVAGAIDADAGMAGDDAVGAEALPHRGEQHRLQVGAVDRELRRVVAGPASGGLAVDELAEAVEERRLARRRRPARASASTPSDAQLGARVRQDVDADAERPDLGRRLVDAAGDAGAVQASASVRPPMPAPTMATSSPGRAARSSGHDLRGAYGAAKISPQRDLLFVPCAS